MVCVNSIVNPFVYVIQYHEFQRRAKEIFCGKGKRPDETDSVSVKTVDMTTVHTISKP